MAQKTDKRIYAFGIFRYAVSFEDDANKNKKRCKRIVFYLVVFSGYYASLIAPTRQPSSQEPQSTHRSGSTTYLLSPSAIAPTGQVSAQAPHWMHSSLITLGIVLSPYKIDSLSLAIILAHPTAFDKS